MALLGGHAGRWVADALAAEGVALDPVAGPGETRMALSVAAEGAADRVLRARAGDRRRALGGLEAAVERVAHGARWVAISGLAPARRT